MHTLDEEDSERLRASLEVRLPEAEIAALAEAARRRLAVLAKAGVDSDLNDLKLYAPDGSRYGKCQRHGEKWCDRCVPCTCMHCTCENCRDTACVQHGEGAPGEPLGYVRDREAALRTALSALVRLKDGPHDEAYRAAWEKARELTR